MKSRKNLEDITALVATLRGPGGCPWDREQTLPDLKTFLIGEAYELLEAIDQHDHRHIAEEAGDLLFIIIFIVDMFREQGIFSIYEVIGAVVEKMVRRHPHVFSSTPLKTSREVRSSWAALKEQEGKPPVGSSILDGIPGFLPALVQAQLISRRASQAGFAWENPGQLIGKVTEELEELQEGISRNDTTAISDELGDLLFAVVSVARHLQLDAEQALHRANKKFTERFRHMEGTLRDAGKDLAETPLEEMIALWEQAKVARP